MFSMSAICDDDMTGRGAALRRLECTELPGGGGVIGIGIGIGEVAVLTIFVLWLFGLWLRLGLLLPVVVLVVLVVRVPEYPPIPPPPPPLPLSGSSVPKSSINLATTTLRRSYSAVPITDTPLPVSSNRYSVVASVLEARECVSSMACSCITEVRACR